MTSDYPTCIPNDLQPRQAVPGFVKTAIALILISAVPFASAAIPSSERQVLLDLYNATVGPNWVDNTGWTGAAGTECSWYGVTCNVGEFNVIWIELPFNGLSGPLPSLTDLPELRVFDVGSNAVEGPIPALPPDIDAFVASNTQISGTIPDLPVLTPGLSTFIVTGSNLSGTIPDFSGMTALNIVNLQNNALEGSLPPMNNLPALQSFSADRNQLVGPIPDLGDLTLLRSFFVGDNELTGNIPDLAGLSNLEFFGAQDNQLSGSIPDLAGLSSLLVFRVENNQLTGPIPPLSGLSSLSTFDVSGNQLTGQLPGFSDTPQLFWFSAENNGLEGEIPSLAGLTQLAAIELAGNRLEGTVPPVADTALIDGESSLCGNQLVSSENESLDQAWVTATGTDWIRCQNIHRPVPVASPWMLLALMTMLFGTAVPFVAGRGVRS